jgi:hypothetical protein
MTWPHAISVNRDMGTAERINAARRERSIGARYVDARCRSGLFEDLGPHWPADSRRSGAAADGEFARPDNPKSRAVDLSCR